MTYFSNKIQNSENKAWLSQTRHLGVEAAKQCSFKAKMLVLVISVLLYQKKSKKQNPKQFMIISKENTYFSNVAKCAFFFLPKDLESQKEKKPQEL